MERLQDALTDGDNMKQIFVFTTTLTLLLTLGFKAEAGWNIVSSPNADALDNVLLAQYAASSSDIWAVGYYHSANPGLQNQPLFNHWNGIAWSNVSMSQAFGINSDLFGIGGIASSDVWAVGSIQTAVSGPWAALVLHWNGTSWAQISLPSTSNQESLRAIAEISSTDIWTVGWYNDGATHPLAIHWDGFQWTRVTLPDPDPGGSGSWLSTVTAIASNDVWAFGSDSNLLRGLAYHWNGSSWSQVSVPAVGQSSSISGAYAAASNMIWAVGSYQHDGPHWYTMILYWNGLYWSQVTSPNKCTGSTADSFLHAVAGFSSSDIWAVGAYNCSGTEQTLTMHFDGSSWKIVLSPNSGSGDNSLYSISTSRDSSVVRQWMNAVGVYFDTTTLFERTLAEQNHIP
jgi:hypothetical protein